MYSRRFSSLTHNQFTEYENIKITFFLLRIIWKTSKIKSIDILFLDFVILYAVSKLFIFCNMVQVYDELNNQHYIIIQGHNMYIYNLHILIHIIYIRDFTKCRYFVTYSTNYSNSKHNKLLTINT